MAHPFPFLIHLETDMRTYVLSIISSKYSSCLKGEGWALGTQLDDRATIDRSVNEPLASDFKDTAW